MITFILETRRWVVSHKIYTQPAKSSHFFVSPPFTMSYLDSGKGMCSNLDGHIGYHTTYQVLFEPLTETRNEPMVSNSSTTEWSTIKGVIVQMISKLAERAARGRYNLGSNWFQNQPNSQHEAD